MLRRVSLSVRSSSWAAVVNIYAVSPLKLNEVLKINLLAEEAEEALQVVVVHGLDLLPVANLVMKDSP